MDIHLCRMERMATNLPKLRAWRKARGLTLEEVGAALGITKAPISKWERGEAPVPFERRDALAELYGVPVEEMHALLAEVNGKGDITHMAAMIESLLAQQVSYRADMAALTAAMSALTDKISLLEVPARRPRSA